jgi:hypothetical protein
MKRIIIICILFLSTSCSSSSENKKDNRKVNLDVLAISFNDLDLAAVSGWSAHMPNYTIQTLNASTNIVTMAQLDTQDVVILFTNHVKNTKVTGDTLYQHVMSGGNVILGTFYSQQSGSIGNQQDFGALETISPSFHNKSAYRNDTLIVRASHPILTGIDTLITYYGAGSDSLHNGGKELLAWNNGESLLSVNEPAGRIYNLSVFPTETRYTTVLKTASNNNNLENFYKLWASMIRFSHSLNFYEDDFKYTPNHEAIEVSHHQTNKLKTNSAANQK